MLTDMFPSLTVNVDNVDGMDRMDRLPTAYFLKRLPDAEEDGGRGFVRAAV